MATVFWDRNYHFDWLPEKTTINSDYYVGELKELRQAIKRFSAKNKHALVYPDLDSARRPIPHDISLPIPIFKPQQIKIGSDMVEDVHADSTDANYVPEDELLEPQTFTLGELNDLVRDLDLSKDKAELFASRLKQKTYSTKMSCIPLSQAKFRSRSILHH
ncbi:hypothetical protein LOD99_14578 [Oopsacas minuta]|uniref:Uncharacterized protein n=1 Tax=Oopsacas minuta TaxID=111878 RepID=A0AAV7KFH6_9METZ|nr:hypothetical protein LOD99_14578 [Oopsacas minuta]